ncbi:MAG: isoprenylcysteine carboxylmethyltransferase family protein [Anaerolineales bacterium]|nr:MAG: isoprenylcysteine carboxylmethyltransferase family protein [Anaerolineales bacterium]
MLINLANILGLVLTWIIWLLVINREFSLGSSLAISIGGPLLVTPIVYLGRRLLDQQPVVRRAAWVTTAVHYLLLTLLGMSVIEATQLAQNLTLWAIRLPPWLGILIMVVSGVALVLVVFNLALKGFGLPFALALTRLVATDWLYAWTRNPMVLSALAFLVGLGLWLQSGLFLVWTLVVFSPAMYVFLVVYEERELEIRFGEDYLEYKTRTPMFWPRRPRRNQ